MTRDEAAALRAAEGAEVRLLSRKSRHELAAIEASEGAARGLTHLFGGPSSKDALIRAILEFRYPQARQNEAAHVLGHNPGERWSACEWCCCQATRTQRSEHGAYDVLVQCGRGPGHDGDHGDWF
jgi:hypothetical protein